MPIVALPLPWLKFSFPFGALGGWFVGEGLGLQFSWCSWGNETCVGAVFLVVYISETHHILSASSHFWCDHLSFPFVVLNPSNLLLAYALLFKTLFNGTNMYVRFLGISFMENLRVVYSLFFSRSLHESWLMFGLIGVWWCVVQCYQLLSFSFFEKNHACMEAWWAHGVCFFSFLIFLLGATLVSSI